MSLFQKFWILEKVLTKKSETMIRIVHPEGYLPCSSCGSLGYTDERTYTAAGYLCARCAKPEIDWDEVDAA